jgi:magnesium transporter
MATAADLMTTHVPRASEQNTVLDTMAMLRKGAWEEVGHIYLVDGADRLLGQVPIERFLVADEAMQLSNLRGTPPIEVRPDEDAEMVALKAVERHDADVAVVDRNRHFLGVIPIGRLLALLHEEHVDNFLRFGGVSGLHPAPLGKQDTIAVFRARMPWLVIGLVGGFLAGGIAAFFEFALRQEIALAFFLPLVVYMADAVGTQTETVLVRALAYGKISVANQLLREGMVGSMIGGAIGLLAGVGLWIVEGRPAVALVVALTLAMTALVATMVASLLPLGLSRLEVDPALASGPVATVLQDILSVGIYLGIATAILR